MIPSIICTRTALVYSSANALKYSPKNDGRRQCCRRTSARHGSTHGQKRAQWNKGRLLGDCWGLCSGPDRPDCRQHCCVVCCVCVFVFPTTRGRRTINKNTPHRTYPALNLNPSTRAHNKHCCTTLHFTLHSKSLERPSSVLCLTLPPPLSKPDVSTLRRRRGDRRATAARGRGHLRGRPDPRLGSRRFRRLPRVAPPDLLLESARGGKEEQRRRQR